MLQTGKYRAFLMIGALLVVLVLVVAGCNGLPSVSDASQGVAQAVETVTGAVESAKPAVFQTEPTATPAPAQVVEVKSTDQELLADLYDRVLPSVVNIKVTKSAMVGGEQLPFDLPPGFPHPDVPQAPLRGEGSGWVYDAKGYIVTNNHVVEDAEEIIVTFYNGLWAKAEIVATDPQSDLAVLKVDAPEGVDLKPLPLDEPDTLRVGYTVVAIGAPFGLESTMTTGIVSALGRSFPVGMATGGRYTLPDVIQTDAAINPGNSGGPLLNLNGEVVGVNFAIESPVRGSSGIGFAIPVSIVRRVIPALIEEGVYHYAYLGISGQSVTPELADLLDLPDNVLGAYVAQVVDGGPADKAGVKGGTRPVQAGEGPDGPITLYAGGDIIVAIDGHPVRQFTDLVSYLVTKAEPGQKVTLTVLRDGKEIDLEVTLGERPKQLPAPETEGKAGISSSAAVAIARDTVINEKLLKGEIKETVARQDTYKGRDVWVVEMSDGRQTATVVIDAKTGDVLQTSVR